MDVILLLRPQPTPPSLERNIDPRFGYVDSLFKSLLPDTAPNEFGPVCKVFRVIADKIRSEIPPVDISEVMAEIEALREKFDKGRKTVEVLRADLTFKLARMIQLNRTRLDHLEEFQRIIEEYNSGAINVQIFFDKLLVFAKRLDAEEKRGIAERLTEGRARDLRPSDQAADGPDEKRDRRSQKGGQTLLDKLKKEKLVLDWRKQQTTRAGVRTAIKEVLDEVPRAYTTELYRHKCDSVYQHFYDAYAGQGKSLYSS